MTAPTSSDVTWMAPLTPPGVSAIATLGVYGPQAWLAIRKLFHFRDPNRQLPEQPQPGRFWLGRLGDSTTAGDEVVLSVHETRDAPHLELHFHGGKEVIRWLLDMLTANGLTACRWQDLERKMNPDTLQAAALEAMAEAPTARTAAIILDQYHGAFRRALETVLACLEHAELEIAGKALENLANWTSLGRHLVQPWRVTVAGAPNVGKSSLVNALAGFTRCVVAPTPGTTRDVVTTLIAVNGWPVELHDTAGLRDETEFLELEGMELARSAAEQADLCLWVADGSTAPVFPAISQRAVRSVINKVDLPPAWDFGQLPDALPVSAVTRAGVDRLCEALGKWLVPESPSPGTPVPFTPALCDAVETAWKHWQADNREEVRKVLQVMLND